MRINSFTEIHNYAFLLLNIAAIPLVSMAITIAVNRQRFVAVRIEFLPSPEIGAHVFDVAVRLPAKLLLGQGSGNFMHIYHFD